MGIATEEFLDVTSGEVTVPDAHFMCRVCYPENFIGMRAICGHELLGVTAPPDAPMCGTCDEKVYPHILNHQLNMRG